MTAPAQTNFMAGSLGGALSTRTVASKNDSKQTQKKAESSFTGDAPAQTPVSTAETVNRTSAEVPEGTAAEVLKWVGDDAQRATEALQVENSSEKPRSTLVAELQRVEKRSDEDQSKD